MFNSITKLVSLALILLLQQSVFAQDELSSGEKRHMAIIVNGNVGATMPFPFYHIPEDRSASMRIRPYVGLQYNTELSDKWLLKCNAAYSSKAVDFSANLVDQPYNGYIKTEINGQISEGTVEDAYFSGYSEGFFKLHYLEANLNAARRLGSKSTVYAGMYLAFLLDASNEVYVDGTVSLGPGLPPISSQFQRTEDYSDQINPVDFGFMVGYEHKIYRELNINGHFSSSLNSVYSSSLEAVEHAMLNMYASIGITYFFTSSIYD